MCIDSSRSNPSNQEFFLQFSSIQFFDQANNRFFPYFLFRLSIINFPSNQEKVLRVNNLLFWRYPTTFHQKSQLFTQNAKFVKQALTWHLKLWRNLKTICHHKLPYPFLLGQSIHLRSHFFDRPRCKLSCFAQTHGNGLPLDQSEINEMIY